MKLFTVLCTIFLSLSAFAYIPPYWMVMSKTAEQHGKGIYYVDQDVVFQGPNGEPLVVNERWTIQNENSMRLEVTGRKELKDKVRLTFVYEDGKRYFVDENGVKKQARISAEFFEPLFHFRFSKNIKPYLVSQKIAPPESLRSEPHKYSQKHPSAEPESFMRLSRSGGVLTYAVGTPTPAGASELPGLWIDQDQFVVRKVRYPTTTTVTAKDYKNFAQGLWLPKEREVNFNQHIVEITVNAVNSVTATPQIKTRLSVGGLNFGENPNLAAIIPQEQVIKEFYTRLR
jgi:hypothetical protein